MQIEAALLDCFGLYAGVCEGYSGFVQWLKGCWLKSRSIACYLSIMLSTICVNKEKHIVNQMIILLNYATCLFLFLMTYMLKLTS